MPFDDELFAALGEQYDFVPTPNAGGMGEVYQARHRLLGEVRAIKVIRPGASRGAGLQQRFLREARIASRLDHPNLVRLYDFAINEDGLAWMVLEWVHGLDLSKLLDRVGRLPLDEALSIAEQTLSCLTYLHSRGIVHRDISSDNLMVSKSPDSGARVKLIDLGIAKGIEGSLDLTATGHFVGKLRYAAPEMLDSKRERKSELDARSDLYSFGVVFYEMLTGIAPIAGDTTSELIAGHLIHPPQPFEESDPDGRVPEEIRRIALRSLEKQPENRYQSAESLALDLAEARRVLAARQTAPDFRQTVDLVTVGPGPSAVDPELEEERARLALALSEVATGKGGLEDTAVQKVGAEQEEEAWFEHLRDTFQRRNSKHPGVASSVIQVLQEHPRAALSGVFGIALVVVVLFSGVLAGTDSPASGEISDSLSEAQTLREPGAEPLEVAASETGEARSEEPPASRDGEAAAGTGPEMDSVRKRPFSIILISDNAQLSTLFLDRFGRDFPVEIGSSLSRVLSGGGRGLAIQLSGETRAISVEAYETSLPSCEAVASATIVAVPSGRSKHSRSVPRTAPRCSRAITLAGTALAADLDSKVRALASELR